MLDVASRFSRNDRSEKGSRTERSRNPGGD